jgi:hypothetical protein
MAVHGPDRVLWGLAGVPPLHRPDQRALMNATRRKETTMSDLKSSLTSLALAVALVFPMAVCAADENVPSTITVETTHDEGVGWFVTLNHARCGAIPGELGDINPIDRAPTAPLGDRVAQITTTVAADGSRQAERFDLTTGIAQDSHGGRYIWTYENQLVYEVPPGEGPVHVSSIMFDRFRLIGNGFNMGVTFNWSWKFEVPSGSAFDPGSEFTGVVFPNDPVKPTNVSNFKNFGTQGDPACDPL